MKTSVLAARTIVVAFGLCLATAVSYGLYMADDARPSHVWFLVYTRNLPLQLLAALGVILGFVGGVGAIIFLGHWLLDVAGWLNRSSNQKGAVR